MSSTDRYAAAGVDLDAADQAKRRIQALVAKTRTPLSLGALGGFGGMVRVPAGFAAPVLVMSTDGVGTKVLVAALAGVHDTVGEDLVNHCVNDILVHGAQPLAFMDYIASGHLVPEVAEGLVRGISRGCLAHEMTLAGGETAELPDLYAEGHYDLAGTIVGIVEEGAALHGDKVQPGDVLVGLASSGLHTNGYTLARRIVFDQLHLGRSRSVSRLERDRRRRAARRAPELLRGAAADARPGARPGPHHRWRDRGEPGPGTARGLRGGGAERQLGVAARVSCTENCRARCRSTRCAACSTSASA